MLQLEVYPCFVVVGVFMSFFLQYGVVYGIGIYYVLIAEYYSIGAMQVSLLCSIFTAIFFAIAPVSAVLTNRYGCRPVVMAGGIISCLGFGISSMISKIEYLYFTFGVLAGSGLGMCGAPTTVIVPHYFTARRPLAYGIGLSGVGLGAFAFPQVVSLLVTQYNLRGALLLTGGLSLHLTLCGTIFKPGRELKQMTTNGEKGPGLLQLSLFRDPLFLELSLTCFLAGFAQSIVHVHIAAYALSLGINHQGATNVISLIGGLNCLGRVIFGIVPMIRCLGVFIPYITGLLLSGVFVSFLAWTQSYHSLCAVAGLFGFMYAAFGAIMPQVLLQAVGQGKLASAFGFQQVFVGTGSLIGAPVAGLLYEATSSYSYSFYLGGGAWVGSAIAALLALCHRRKTLIEETTIE